MSSREQYIDPDPAKLQFAIIPVVTPPTNAIAHGSLDAVMEHIVDSQVRSDAEDLLAAAAQAIGSLENTQVQSNQTFARGIQMLNDMMDHMSRRLDSLVSRRADKAHRDEREEREAQQKADRINTALDTLNQHMGGELRTIPPSQPEDEEELRASDQGDLPTPLLKDTPLDPGTEPVDPDPTEGRVQPQPISVSLNARS
jgi:hypothetical protein